MPRAQKVLPKGAAREARRDARIDRPFNASLQCSAGDIIDTLLLKYEDRCKQQGFAFGGKGTCVEFDFPAPPSLRTDDLVVLDDGTLVEVVADVEPVLEVRATDFAATAHLVLALGNRHVPVQILPNRIRLQKRPEIEALVAEHGLKSTELMAPFEPDGGAQGHAHHHGDEHGHDHHEQHHHHGHGHNHDHPQDHDHASSQ